MSGPGQRPIRTSQVNHPFQVGPRTFYSVGGENMSEDAPARSARLPEANGVWGALNNIETDRVEVRIYGRPGDVSTSQSPPPDEKGLSRWTTFVSMSEFRQALLSPDAHVRDIRANIPAMREDTGPDPAMNDIVERITAGAYGPGMGRLYDGIWSIDIGESGPRRY